MSISAINSAAQASSSSSIQASLAAAVEEATESAATTRQEAAQGDQVAIRRLARRTSQKPAAAPVREAGKGERIDHTA